MFVDVAVRADSGAGDLQFLLHAGEAQDTRGSVVVGQATEVWLVSGNNTVFLEAVDPASIPRGDLGKARRTSHLQR